MTSTVKPSSYSRRTACAAIGLLLLSACEEKPMTVTLDVVLFSYLDRPIFDVHLNRTDIGVAGPWPYSGRGSMSGVQLPLGPQKITWRLDGGDKNDVPLKDNGETVTAKNTPELKDIPKDARYLGVHVYADGMVELIASQNFPDLSPRGETFDTEWKKNHGE